MALCPRLKPGVKTAPLTPGFSPGLLGMTFAAASACYDASGHTTAFQELFRQKIIARNLLPAEREEVPYLVSSSSGLTLDR
jgi:hypothetical protein